VETADYAWSLRVDVAAHGGLHLRMLEEMIESRLSFAAQWGTQTMSAGARLFRDFARRMIAGPAPKPGETALLDVETSAALDSWSKQHVTALLLVLFGRWREASTLLADVGLHLEQAIPGGWHGPAGRMLTGVSAAALLADPSTPAGERRQLRRRLNDSHRALRSWVAKGGNFAAMEAMLHGEQRNLAGDLEGAARLFTEARTIAGEQRNPWLEALALERLAAAALQRGLDRFAFTPLRDARERYLSWGAFTKVAALDARWPELARASAASSGVRRERGDTSASSSSSTSRALDSATLLAAAQTIIDDIRLDEVITRVLRLAVENAGAERGSLLLATGGKLTLAAESSAETGHTELLLSPRPL
ncbi:MAG: hypothetical protein KC431_27235, partial [Myxococcales bacterium]|nr:hypothetical protein [Myxococcales bacterium]